MLPPEVPCLNALSKSALVFILLFQSEIKHLVFIVSSHLDTTILESPVDIIRSRCLQMSSSIH